MLSAQLSMLNECPSSQSSNALNFEHCPLSLAFTEGPIKYVRALRNGRANKVYARVETSLVALRG